MMMISPSDRLPSLPYYARVEPDGRCVVYFVRSDLKLRLSRKRNSRNLDLWRLWACVELGDTEIEYGWSAPTLRTVRDLWQDCDDPDVAPHADAILCAWIEGGAA